jgi:hypothetical protein
LLFHDLGQVRLTRSRVSALAKFIIRYSFQQMALMVYTSGKMAELDRVYHVVSRLA